MVAHVPANSRAAPPAGAFVRRWVPELAALRTDFIHEPWQAPSDVLAAAGVRLGEEYPFPVVSLAESQAALARASGIVQRCTVQRSLQTSEPYRAPTVPVEVRARLCMCPQHKVRAATCQWAAFSRCFEHSARGADQAARA